jgi:hypothetical protein
MSEQRTLIKKQRHKVNKYTWPKTNSKYYSWVNTAPRRKNQPSWTELNIEIITHNKHGGNRGLNTWTCNWIMKTRCVENKDKTNGKWKMDQRWLEDRWRRLPNAARTRRGTDLGGSRDSNTNMLVNFAIMHIATWSRKRHQFNSTLMCFGTADSYHYPSREKGHWL